MWPISVWFHVGYDDPIAMMYWNNKSSLNNSKSEARAGADSRQSLPACTTPQTSQGFITDSWLDHILSKQFNSKTRPQFFSIESHNFRNGENINFKMINIQSVSLCSFSDKWLPSHHHWSVLTLRSSFLVLNWNLPFGSFILVILHLSSKTKQKP